jgi:hypothetical protein
MIDSDFASWVRVHNLLDDPESELGLEEGRVPYKCEVKPWVHRAVGCLLFDVRPFRQTGALFDTQTGEQVLRALQYFRESHQVRGSETQDPCTSYPYFVQRPQISKAHSISYPKSSVSLGFNPQELRLELARYQGAFRAINHGVHEMLAEKRKEL